MVQLAPSLLSLPIAVSIEVFNEGTIEELAVTNGELAVTLVQIVWLTKKVSLNSVLMGGHCTTGLQQSPQSYSQSWLLLISSQILFPLNDSLQKPKIIKFYYKKFEYVD